LKFGEMLRVQKPELVISQRHDEWLKHNSNPVYSREALAFGMDQLALQAKPRDRRGTISASSLNSCRRKQQFTFLGMPELPPTPKLAQIFQNGTFMHVRWQMAGLTAGWLAEGEVPVGENPLGLSGTMDGLLDDDSVAEFKSINTNGFSSVNTFGAKEDHIAQVGTYMVATGREKSSILYEDKNTQEFKEIVVHLTPGLEADVRLSADIIWSYISDGKLAEPLATCEERTGYRFTGCPFRDVCLSTRDWTHAKVLAHA
jgi:hypothetical protein